WNAARDARVVRRIDQYCDAAHDRAHLPECLLDHLRLLRDHVAKHALVAHWPDRPGADDLYARVVVARIFLGTQRPRAGYRNPVDLVPVLVDCFESILARTRRGEQLRMRRVRSQHQRLAFLCATTVHQCWPATAIQGTAHAPARDG